MRIVDRVLSFTPTRVIEATVPRVRDIAVPILYDLSKRARRRLPL